MLTTITVLLACYVLLQAFGDRSRWLTIALHAFVAFAAIYALVDAASLGFTQKPITAYFKSDATSPQTKNTEIGNMKSSARPSVTVSRGDGGSITTQLGYGIAVAKGSSLHREFIAIHD